LPFNGPGRAGNGGFQREGGYFLYIANQRGLPGKIQRDTEYTNTVSTKYLIFSEEVPKNIGVTP
jgi:hypothetical protein